MNSTIYWNTQQGLQMGMSHNFTIANNTIYDNTATLVNLIDGSSNNNISGNTIYNSTGASILYNGIELSATSVYNIINNNTIYGMLAGIATGSSDYNNYTYNIIFNSTEDAINLVSGSENNYVANNQLYN